MQHQYFSYYFDRPCVVCSYPYTLVSLKGIYAKGKVCSGLCHFMKIGSKDLAGSDCDATRMNENLLSQAVLRFSVYGFVGLR